MVLHIQVDHEGGFAHTRVSQYEVEFIRFLFVIERFAQEKVNQGLPAHKLMAKLRFFFLGWGYVLELGLNIIFTCFFNIKVSEIGFEVFCCF